MVIIVTGDRNYKDRETILQALKGAMEVYGDIELVHGDADGADSLADELGKMLKLDRHAYPAKWNKYGKSAGPRRNRHMLDLYPDAIVFAFHDFLSNSKGTKDMVTEAIARGMYVVLYSKGDVIHLEQLDMFDESDSG